MMGTVRVHAWGGWGVGGSMFVVREISVPVSRLGR
jgi:hypothetical protein